MANKIGLVGSYRETQFGAPYFSHDWEIWATAPKNMEWLPMFHAWFEIHDPTWPLVTEEEHVVHGLPTHQEYVDWFSALPLVYVHPDRELEGGFVHYPVDETVAEFGRAPFTSTCAWMFAMALTKEPEAIGLWGFEMSGSDEYRYQRAGLHQLVKVAEDRGIEVIVPEGTTLLNPLQLYGHGHRWESILEFRSEADPKLVQDDSVNATI